MKAFLELLTALLMAVILAAVLVYGLRRRATGPLRGLPVFMLLLFLMIWAVGVWVRPFGPPILGVYWLGYLMVGLIFLLFLAATFDRYEPADVAGKTPLNAEAAAMSMGVFFYLLIFLLLAAIVAAYIHRPPLPVEDYPGR
jgi:hypothetical protein